MKQLTQGHTATKWQLGALSIGPPVLYHPAEVGRDLNCVYQQKVKEPGGCYGVAVGDLPNNACAQ